MRIPAILVLSAFIGLTGCAQAAQPTPKTDDEKALYAVGSLLGTNLRTFNFTDKELEMVKAGLADSAKDKSAMDQAAIEAVLPKLEELQKTRLGEAATKEKAAGAAFLSKAATEKDATKTASGLVIRTIQAGTGAKPTAEDVVKVHYTGKFVDGKVFDSSVERNEPATFPLSGVIPCWTEAVQLMQVGGKAQVICPPELAYGDEGRPPQMRGGATLVFDVELLDIVKEQAEPAAGAAPNTP
jgi:FKBP-type peptidyl-prolyl cis-trans isomerase